MLRTIAKEEGTKVRSGSISTRRTESQRRWRWLPVLWVTASIKGFLVVMLGQQDHFGVNWSKHIALYICLLETTVKSRWKSWLVRVGRTRISRITRKRYEGGFIRFDHRLRYVTCYRMSFRTLIMLYFETCSPSGLSNLSAHFLQSKTKNLETFSST